MDTPDDIPYGYCQCGCGGKTRIAPITRADRGWRKGEPQPFVLRHKRPTISYEVRDAGHDTPCWIWTASISSNGYGKTTHRDRTISAHRFMYERLVGPIPEDLELDHLCRNRACCNPQHLEAVTHAVNMSRGEVASRTHCPQGHPYDEENTRKKGNRRICRTCHNAAAKEYQRRKRASRK